MSFLSVVFTVTCRLVIHLRGTRMDDCPAHPTPSPTPHLIPTSSPPTSSPPHPPPPLTTKVKTMLVPIVAKRDIISMGCILHVFIYTCLFRGRLTYMDEYVPQEYWTGNGEVPNKIDWELTKNSIRWLSVRNCDPAQSSPMETPDMNKKSTCM